MITIIAGTNRKDSEALVFARYYEQLFQKHGKEAVKLLALKDLPADMLHSGMYESEGQSSTLATIQDEYMIAADKFLFVIPEYNGGFPGILKLFLDACSIREYGATFKGKKAALTGIAAGRAGNLRGMDHLAGILNYVGITVMPNKLPISRIETLLDGNRQISDLETQKVMEQQVLEFIGY